MQAPKFNQPKRTALQKEKQNHSFELKKRPTKKPKLAANVSVAPPLPPIRLQKQNTAGAKPKPLLQIHAQNSVGGNLSVDSMSLLTPVRKASSQGSKTVMSDSDRPFNGGGSEKTVQSGSTNQTTGTTKSQREVRKSNWVKSLVITIVVLIAVVVSWNIFLEDIFYFTSSVVTIIHEFGHPWSDILFIGIFLLIVSIGLPAGTLLIVLMAFAIKSPWLPLFYSVFSKMVVSSIYYFVVRSRLASKFKRDYRDKIIYKVIFHECRKHPCLASFFIQFLTIPPALIIIFLALSKVPFGIFFMNLLIFTAGTNMIVAYIGSTLEKPEDFLNLGSGIMDKSTNEKIMFGITVFGIFFSVTFFCCLLWYTRMRIKEIQKKMEEEETQESHKEISPFKSPGIAIEKLKKKRKDKKKQEFNFEQLGNKDLENLSNRELKSNSDLNDSSRFKISRPVSTQSVNIELRGSLNQRTDLNQKNSTKKILFKDKRGGRPQHPSMIEEVDPELESDSRPISKHRKKSFKDLNKL